MAEETKINGNDTGNNTGNNSVGPPTVVKKVKSAWSFAASCEYLRWDHFACSVFKVFRENQIAAANGEGRGPCAEFWTSHKPGRKELRNRTREHWVARTNAFGVRVNGQQVEYWWFPYTKDAVGLMYFRFRKLSEKERWQAEGEIPGSPAKKSGKKKSSDKFVSYHAGVDDERLEIAIDALMGVMVEHKMGDHETAQELLYFVLRAYRPDMFTDFDRTKDPVRCMKWAFENLLAVYKESVTANINEMSGDPKKDLEELEIACREKKKEFMTLFRQYKSR